MLRWRALSLTYMMAVELPRHAGLRHGSTCDMCSAIHLTCVVPGTPHLFGARYMYMYDQGLINCIAS